MIQGRAVIRFRQIHGDRVIEVPVSGEELKVVDIPTGYTHTITNIGEADVITLFWADHIFDPEKTDTFFWKYSRFELTFAFPLFAKERKAKIIKW